MATKLKIAVAVPVYDNVESMFFQSVMSAVSYFYETKLQDDDGEDVEKVLEVFVCSGVIQEARHRLFFEALNWGADYIMWFDSDHVFPPDTIMRMLAHQKQIVACNYPRRVIPGKPTAPVAAVHNRAEAGPNPLLYTTKEKAEAGLVERADHSGMGVVLMHMSVLEQLTEQAEAGGKESFMPLFHWQEKSPNKGEGSIGEDVYFFQKCRDAGIEIWVDHGLSWEVGHITKAILTHAHAERDKKRWDAEG